MGLSLSNPTSSVAPIYTVWNPSCNVPAPGPGDGTDTQFLTIIVFALVVLVRIAGDFGSVIEKEV